MIGWAPAAELATSILVAGGRRHCLREADARRCWTSMLGPMVGLASAGPGERGLHREDLHAQAWQPLTSDAPGLTSGQCLTKVADWLAVHLHRCLLNGSDGELTG